MKCYFIFLNHEIEWPVIIFFFHGPYKNRWWAIWPMDRSWLTLGLAHDSSLYWAWFLRAAFVHESVVICELAQQLC